MGRIAFLIAFFGLAAVVVWALVREPADTSVVAESVAATTTPPASFAPTSPAGDASEPSVATTTAEAPTSAASPDAPPILLDATLPLADLDGWLQSDIDSLGDLEGKVVIVQFWTFGCINCKRTLPTLIDIYESYGRDEVEIVGIHSPEFTYEEDPDAISAAAADLGVSWPIALDTRQRTFFDWQGSPAYWPRTYVLDREGQVRFDHIGEGSYDELRETVELLVDEQG